MTDPFPLILAIIGPMLETPRLITEDTTLRADLGLDDLDLAVLAMELGDAIGREIADETAWQWETVGDVVACVGRIEA